MGKGNIMKKILCAVLVCVMMFAMTACKEEEEVKGAGKASIEQDGVTTTMIFDAKGDTITKVTQTSVMSIEGFTEEQLQIIRDTVADAQDSYAEIEKVEYTTEEKDGQFIETIVIPTDEETLKAVVAAGILPVDGDDVTELSLEQTEKSLEESGWTIE